MEFPQKGACRTGRIFMFKERFKEILCANRLESFATDAIAERFEALTARMLEVNAHMNLTAITDEDGIILKHYTDSLIIAKLLPEGASVIDVGCGAGFPSLPLAIARPDLRITALDSTAKRINYISETAGILGLDNISAVAMRAEEAASNPLYRENFDISCARAVARFAALCELCLPLVRVGGKFIAMKGHSEDEVAEAAGAIKKLGGKLESSESYNISLPGGEENPRSAVVVKKNSLTPENYPRNWSQILKKPL